jgi:protein required for attachment to host cells
MSINSLIIVADASRARLFRTAGTNVAEAPIELVEVGAVEAAARDPRPRDGGLAQGTHGGRDFRDFAVQIAQEVASFAQYHFCNPVVLVATREVSSTLMDELEHRLSNVNLHRVSGDLTGLPPPALLQELQQREALSSPQAKMRGTMEA